jgi:DNA-binding transcriptional LysR family regulator
MVFGPLRAFIETVEAGSIRKASDAKGAYSTSVSRQISKLESVVGVQLLSRDFRGVHLTTAGEAFYDFAKGAVTEFANLREELHDLSGTGGLVRIAMVESVIDCGPISTAAAVRNRFSKVVFQVQVMPALQVVSAVEDGRCDIGITFCARSAPHIVEEANIPETVVLAVRNGHPASRRSSIAIQDLASLPLAMPDHEFRFGQLFEEARGLAGVELDTFITSNSFEVLRAFAATGAGAAVLPYRAVQTHMDRMDLAAVRIDHLVLEKARLDVIRREDVRLPRPVRLYLDLLRTALEAGGPMTIGPRPA